MTGLAHIQFAVDNYPAQQNLAEMEIWPPPQGTIPQLIPVDLELRFDDQVIRTSAGDFLVSLSRANIQLVLDGMDVVRGSKFGDEINEPFVVADVVQSVRTELETKSESGYNLGVTLTKSAFGTISAFIKRKRKTKNTLNTDRIAKASINHYRVIARNNNRWSIVEPTEPYLLRGRYLGEKSGNTMNEKSDPICFLNLTSTPSEAKLFLRANFSDIHVVQYNTENNFVASRNKDAIISQLVRLSLYGSKHSTLGLQESPERDGLLLCQSVLRCKHD